MKSRAWNARWVALLLMALSLPLQAQQWDELSEAEQAVLAPWKPEWAGLSEERRARLLDGAERWQSMTPEQRDEVRRRLHAWEAMTPEERARVRSRMERFREMPEAERDRVREGMQRLRDLPPEQRRELRRRWESMDRGERRAFLDGFAASEHLRQREWMATLTPDQRRELREIADGMDRIQRYAVTAKVRSLPDNEARADYARRLIEADDETRAEIVEAAEQELRAGGDGR